MAEEPDDWYVPKEASDGEVDDWKLPPEETGALGSFGAGAIHGATAGLNTQLNALNTASGMPRWVPGAISYPTGAAKLGYEYLTGEGPATEAYHKSIEEQQRRHEMMQQQHPIAYGGGELTGAGASMLALPTARVAGFIPQAIQAAKIGAGYGAVSGAEKGLEESGPSGIIPGAAVGAGEGTIGGIGGAGLGSIAGKIGKVTYDYLGRPIVSTIRGLRNQEEEAATRVAGALMRDYPQIESGKSLGMTPAEWVRAKANGEPVTMMDLGGETTRSLMRSAANTSPEGRALLEGVINQRFAEQAERGGTTVRGLISGEANAAKTRAQLEAAYDAERGTAYRLAYQMGDRPIWSPELERLTSAPSVAGALRGAVNKWRDWQVKDGYGAMNPPVRVTEDGRLQFLPGGGTLPYPNMQLWDYAARNLAGEASAAYRAGNTAEYSRLNGLEKQLKGELDNLVPEFKQARGIAATYFGGNNALEAGEKAVTFKGDLGEIKKNVAKMEPAEREMFQEAYADAYARRIENFGDNTNVVGRVMNSPQERAKFLAIMGPEATANMQGFIARERIYDAARKALGNSTTVRQMIEAGLAGGAGTYAITGDPRTALEVGAGLAGGAGFGAISGMTKHGLMEAAQHVIKSVDRKTAQRVAELLTSDDPRELQKGLKLAARNQNIKDGLNTIANRLYTTAGAHSASRIGPYQIPSAINAEENQQKIPRPIPQQNRGGKVEKPTSISHLGRLLPFDSPIKSALSTGRKYIK